MVKLRTRLFTSKVARRMLALFVACALLPISVLAAISFIQVSRQLREQAQLQLRQASKSQGMAVYEHLLMLELQLNPASPLAAGDAPSSILPRGFRAVKLVRGNELTRLLASSGFTDAEDQHLASGKALIRVRPAPGQGPGYCIQMLKLADPGQPKSGILVADIDPDYLWNADRLPVNLQLSVVSPGIGVLFDSNPYNKPSPGEMVPPGNSSGLFQWQYSGRQYDAAYWELHLRPQFFTSAWTVVMSQSQQDTFAPVKNFRYTFTGILLLTLWIVALLSSIQIRRTLVPLEQLREVTQQIAEQKFDARVEVTSNDEFQDLAGSFNSMSTRLARQFQTLKSMNEIDKAILSSLKHETVIREALRHIPALLPCDSFGIVMFQRHDDGPHSAQLTIASSRGSLQQRLQECLVSSGELQELENCTGVQVLHADEQIPLYLQPLTGPATRAVFVFPVLLENRVFAVLAIGSSTAAGLELEDIQRARQIADQLAVAFSNVRLIDALEQLHWGTLTALARAIDAKSAWTAGHSERVTALALRIGGAMGLSTRDLQIMHRGGLLHDVGKIGTPAKVLDKPGRLDDQEMQTMRDHVRIGIRILEPIAAFREAIPVVAQHHEWFDGSGYPEGLAGENIALPARIFAVADCYDAMISDRPYRKGLPREKVIEALTQRSGTQFDPKVIEVFRRLCDE
ncbi:MAG TPA: HD domain-containing phosphohydrolase, partial [Terriglobales bacterium]